MGWDALKTFLPSLWAGAEALSCDITTGKLLHMLEGHNMPICSLTFSLESQILVIALDDGSVKICDIQHTSLAGTLSVPASWVLNVAFCPGDTHLVSS